MKGHDGTDEASAERVRIYALAGSNAIGKATPVVEAALRAEFGIGDPARLSVAVHPSGYIDVFNEKELWARTVAPSLPSAAVAEERAKRFLAGLAKRLAPLASGEPSLVWIPPVPARPLELLALPAPGKAWFDHWLYRTQPQLSCGRGKPALPVFGSQLEVRVGHGGAVIGYSARWRPITGATREVSATPWRASEMAHDHGGGERHGDHRHPETPARAYVLDGAILPQLYLAPYYLATSGHHFEFVSASPVSLTVDFVLSDDAESTTIGALVRGGSGAYDFAWNALPAGDPFVDRVELGRGAPAEMAGEAVMSQVSLPKGAWTVLVHVVDRETGAFKHQQQAVFSCPFSVRGEPGFALPDDETRVIRAVDLPPPSPPVS